MQRRHLRFLMNLKKKRPELFKGIRRMESLAWAMTASQRLEVIKSAKEYEKSAKFLARGLAKKEIYQGKEFLDEEIRSKAI